MANFPNSSRYRSTGKKTAANAGVAGRAWSAHNNSSAHGRTAGQPTSMGWVWGAVVLGLLIAFPYHVLGFIGVALVIGWFFGKKK